VRLVGVFMDDKKYRAVSKQFHLQACHKNSLPGFVTKIRKPWKWTHGNRAWF
jgi:hypothetical protein